jgi:hypothetical protein
MWRPERPLFNGQPGTSLKDARNGHFSGLRDTL